jgi:hypothetical protein
MTLNYSKHKTILLQILKDIYVDYSKNKITYFAETNRYSKRVIFGDS